MLVPNNRDLQGKRLWLPNSLENNFTITYPSNTGHKSLSTYRANSIMNLFNSLSKVWNSLNWSCWIVKIFILLMHSLTHLLSLAPSLIHSLTPSLIHSLAHSLTDSLTACPQGVALRYILYSDHQCWPAKYRNSPKLSRGIFHALIFIVNKFSSETYVTKIIYRRTL